LSHIESVCEEHSASTFGIFTVVNQSPYGKIRFCLVYGMVKQRAVS